MLLAAARVQRDSARAERDRAESRLVPLTTAELHAAILKRLTPGKGALLRAAIGVYPRDLTRELRGERANRSANSSTSEADVADLRSLGLIRYPQKGTVAATELLFLERIAGS